MCRAVGYIPELIVLKTQGRSGLKVDTHYFTQCLPTWSNKSEMTFTVIKTVALYTVPLLFMTVAYCQIVKVLWRSDNIPGHTETRNHHSTSCNNTLGSGRRNTINTTNANTTTEGQLRSRRKAAKMLVAVVVMFAVCYFPVHLLNILRLLMWFEELGVEGDWREKVHDNHMEPRARDLKEVWREIGERRFMTEQYGVSIWLENSRSYMWRGLEREGSVQNVVEATCLVDAKIGSLVPLYQGLSVRLNEEEVTTGESPPLPEQGVLTYVITTVRYEALLSPVGMSAQHCTAPYGLTADHAAWFIRCRIRHPNDSYLHYIDGKQSICIHT
uniref:G-protein coupled receptors family 1 profile domain-containing protein n=1 Tax=Timema bartmani TaxID=61472 RepID=A0A7R9F0E2_9NEOP|nr:unnamed protein product [Timema bartmani]